MIFGWRVAYEISSKRHLTKRGKNHLTKHSLEILQERTEQDDVTLVQAMLQSHFGGLRL